MNCQRREERTRWVEERFLLSFIAEQLPVLSLHRSMWDGMHVTIARSSASDRCLGREDGFPSQVTCAIHDQPAQPTTFTDVLSSSAEEVTRAPSYVKDETG